MRSPLLSPPSSVPPVFFTDSPSLSPLARASCSRLVSCRVCLLMHLVGVSCVILGASFSVSIRTCRLLVSRLSCSSRLVCLPVSNGRHVRALLGILRSRAPAPSRRASASFSLAFSRLSLVVVSRVHHDVSVAAASLSSPVDVASCASALLSRPPRLRVTSSDPAPLSLAPTQSTHRISLTLSLTLTDWRLRLSKTSCALRPRTSAKPSC